MISFLDWDDYFEACWLEAGFENGKDYVLYLQKQKNILEQRVFNLESENSVLRQENTQLTNELENVKG